MEEDFFVDRVVVLPERRRKGRNSFGNLWFDQSYVCVDLGGIEPPTFAMRMQRSSQLSYRPKPCLLMLSGSIVFQVEHFFKGVIEIYDKLKGLGLD